MLARRTFFVAGSLALPRSAAQKLTLYANVGPDLTHYEVSVVSAELTKRETDYASCDCAICLAACVAPVSSCFCS